MCLLSLDYYYDISDYFQEQTRHPDIFDTIRDKIERDTADAYAFRVMYIVTFSKYVLYFPCFKSKQVQKRFQISVFFVFSF